MKSLFIGAAAIAACLGFAAGSQAVAPPLATAFLGWTVSPGTFANGVWTIPGTTDITASVKDAAGQNITEGELVWETCTGTGQDSGTHHPAADCQQSGPVRWKGNTTVNLANPIAISPCFCAGDQQGFRLVYRGGRRTGFASATGTPFDVFAESSCPARVDCP
jgi:hypothetical protein